MKTKSKLDKFTPLVIGTAMLTLVTACGSDDDDNSGSVQLPQEEQTQEGTYRVLLAPVNADVAGSATGTGEFVISGDEFKATMTISGAQASSHPMNIFSGSACPTAASNTNNDNAIDVVETVAASGGILIPLDSDLGEQVAGTYSETGTGFTYNQSASFLAMLGDLKLPDLDTSDPFVKLGDSDLNLAGRVVIVHGVANTTELDETVAGVGDLSPAAALPILCGVIEKVEGEETDTATAAATTAAAATAAATTAAASTAAAATSDASTSDASTAASTDSSTSESTTSDATTGGETNGSTTGTTSGMTSSI